MTPEIGDNHATLKTILDSDPFNVYCIDCKKNVADHASITYGVFICGDCAKGHLVHLGMEYSYIKSLYKEVWDQYQLNFMQLGGNKLFYEFLKEYGI